MVGSADILGKFIIAVAENKSNIVNIHNLTKHKINNRKNNLKIIVVIARKPAL